MNPAERPAEPDLETEGPAYPGDPLPAGSVRLPRNRLVAVAVGAAVAVVAGAGILTGISRARHADLDSGDGIRVEASKAPPSKGVVQATPILPLAGPEPGSDPIGAPVGDANANSDLGPGILPKPQEGPALPPGAGTQPAAPQDGASRDDDASPSTSDDAAPPPTPRPNARPQILASAATGACVAPQTRVQQVICADPRLAAADRRLRRAYQQALSDTDDPDSLSARQARWLAARDRAASQGDAAALSDLYAQRLRELEPQ